jgi:hypothetical protein
MAAGPVGPAQATLSGKTFTNGAGDTVNAQPLGEMRSLGLASVDIAISRDIQAPSVGLRCRLRENPRASRDLLTCWLMRLV